MAQSIDQVLLGTPATGERGSGDEEGEGDKFVRQLFESLLLGTKASNAIPDGEGLEDYAYNATFPEFRSRAEGCGKQVLELIQIFLNHVHQEGELGLPEVGDAGDPEVFQGIADVVETLLEDVDSYLDEASGKGANQQVALMRDQLKTVASAARSGPGRYASMVANVQNIPKPQMAFRDQIDNARDTPFVPRLRGKPNAVTPLDLSPIADLPTSMKMTDEKADSSSGVGDGAGGGDGGCGFHYPHPYEVEVRAFHYMPSQVQAPDASKLVPPSSLDAEDFTPAIFVDTVEGLEAMISHIIGDGPALSAAGAAAADSSSGGGDDEEAGRRAGSSMVGSGGARCREIAIDLEHHSFRSFQGIICLMQLSTRERDYIVDPLKLRGEMGRLLPVFTDPTIVKVLHGSDSDILWLQRDLSLYIVNMFDTGQAARQLVLPSFALSHLVHSFCNLHLDKKHQLSDWRMRPLPAEMLKYAQSDTHYLLYIYDRLRIDLERGGGDVAVKSVLDASREICLRRYEKPHFVERDWVTVLRRQGHGVAEELDEVSKRIMASLWEWRDRTAREEDESWGYVMSIYVMIRIARTMPSTRDELEGCGNPLPPLLLERAEEIMGIVESAKRGDKETQPQESTPQNPRTPAGAGTRGSLAGVAAANSGTGGSGSGGGAPGSARLASSVVVGSAGPAIGIGSSSRVFNPVSSAEPYFRPFNVTPSSASQFVLNEASRGSPSPHLVHQSPVLDTEELYRAAGWMTPLPNEGGGGVGGGGGAGSANGGVDAENVGRDAGDLSDDEGMASLTPALLFHRPQNSVGGDYGVVTPGDMSATRKKRIVVLSSKNDLLDTSQRMQHSLALGGTGTGVGSDGRRGHSGMMAIGGANSGPDATNPENGIRIAERIRNEIAREPVLSLANLDGFSGDGPGRGRNTGEDFDDEEDEDEDEDDRPEEEDYASDSDDPGIPKSIAEIYEISNRNRRRNKEKKKLRETSGTENPSPGRKDLSASAPTSAFGSGSASASVAGAGSVMGAPGQPPSAMPGAGGVSGVADASGTVSGAEGGADVASGGAGGGAAASFESGPAANYFSGRKRAKGDGSGGQGQGGGLGLLLDRGRGGGSGGGGPGVDARNLDDTMEFMEDLGWLSRGQRELMNQQNSPAGAAVTGSDGAASSLDRSLSSGSNGIQGASVDGAGVGDDGHARGSGGGAGARSRGGRSGGTGTLDRGGSGVRGQGTPGRAGGGGSGSLGGGHGGQRSRGGTPKRDRDGGRSAVVSAAGRGGVQPTVYRGYDFTQAPPSMGAYQGSQQQQQQQQQQQGQGVQREGSAGGVGVRGGTGAGGGGGAGVGGSGGGGEGVFNPFLAAGSAGVTMGIGDNVPGAPGQGMYNGRPQQQQGQGQEQEQEHQPQQQQDQQHQPQPQQSQPPPTIPQQQQEQDHHQQQQQQKQQPEQQEQQQQQQQKQQPPEQQEQQQQQLHWRGRPDNEKSKSMTYGVQSMQGLGGGQGRGGIGNGSRRGR